MKAEGDRLAALLRATVADRKKLLEVSRFATTLIAQGETDLMESAAGEIQRLLALLRRLEWSGGGEEERPRCPCCGAEAEGPLKEHGQGCLLAVAIAAWRRA